MNKQEVIVILGTAHLITTPGKRSPDGRLREPFYSREIVNRVEAELRRRGYVVMVDYRPMEPSADMKSSAWMTEMNRELNHRVSFVNGVCSKNGAGKCLYVSIHVNAAGNGEKWLDARGFSVYVYTGASQKSRKLAQLLYDEAEKLGLQGDRWVPEERYWKANYKVLKETSCPAVLTENLFQDNREDVDYLLSDEGKEAITKLHVQGIERYVSEVL